MPRKPSIQEPGGFQVRHRVLGVYQGRAIDLVFWHPSSGMPEHGLYRFSTQDKAQTLIDAFSSAVSEPMDQNDLTIEPYDRAEHDRLISDNPLPSAWEMPT
ncbi:hypothetical protein [Candidatus Nitrospira nitrificans]|jgi:hypothetical protein|uniref:Uncharacterized protein n=1 Tax=Candidatus Nitrospira nitrificans TaxID=1742973 RepID=A0A0S4LTR4_9BACT|nr:hypothetical protein [Candidatus Nitrospira nitrificans]CUS39270.1 conserved hypothetical protein [Candidatus Nitrospira nitrificans]